MLVIIVFIVLLLIGLPLYFVLGLSSLVYFLSADLPAWIILQRQFVGLNSFVMVAVPLFLLAGNLMDEGGTLTRIIRFSKVLVGRFRGGMAHVNILASMFFAGITGNAVADVAALGPLEIEMMDAQGYEKDFSAALTVASASIGPIIPPSVPIIMYGVVSNTSIGSLFAAGLIPGVLMGLSLMVLVGIIAHKKKFPTSEAYSFLEIVKEFFKAVGSLIMPILILVGIYTGFFTPTEAAAVACLYALFLGLFVYKEIKWRDLPRIFIKTGTSLGSVSTLFAIAACFTYLISLENVPVLISTFISGVTTNKIILLLLINLVLLLLGCFMEGISAILITTPLLLPIVIQIGVDPVHFGIIMIINLTLGLLTPPLGISLFVVSSIAKLPVTKVVKRVIPMFLVLLVILLIITFVPIISMALPNLFFN
ncbi:MAG: TRAP transporter large permease [Bacteroidetes bacterium]|nr:TRAP transporter large permease [Bacteroidota bacterium]